MAGLLVVSDVDFLLASMNAAIAKPNVIITIAVIVANVINKIFCCFIAETDYLML